MVLASVIMNVVALFGMFLLGTNFAFIIHAKDLFPAQTCRFWRVFFVGKSFLTGLISYDVYRYRGPITWMLYLLMIGILISLGALWVIWYDRPYRGISTKDVVSSTNQTVIVRGRERKKRT